MSNIKNMFDGITPRKKAILTKLAGEFIDGITFDPTFSDEEVNYLLISVKDEIEQWFENDKKAFDEED